MGVRKTETRIPANFQASDLGQSIVAADGRCALVSFTTSPLVAERDNTYVLFITDATLATTTQSFEWSFVENGEGREVETTEFGETTYFPQSTGALELTVRMLGADNAEQARLTLTQEIVSLNADLEALITTASEAPGPGIGNPEVARELINDHNPYYQGVTLQARESGDGFKNFVFSMVSDGALRQGLARRKEHLDRLAGSLNNEEGAFVTLSSEGAGVCGIRLALLAMTLPTKSTPLINWTELPEQASQRAAADERLREALGALNEEAQLDLFNLVRFPKSNIVQCGRLLEVLRDHYFNGKNFNDILTGMSGTRAHWIVRHYREGPLLRS